MSQTKKKQTSNRRSQFNIQASGLSDKAYLYIEALSTKKELSQKFWEWAEKEINGEYHSNPSRLDTSSSQLEQQVQMLQQQLGILMGQFQPPPQMGGMNGYMPMNPMIYQQPPTHYQPYPNMQGQNQHMQGQPTMQGQPHMPNQPYMQPTSNQRQPVSNYPNHMSAPKGTGYTAQKEPYVKPVSKNVSTSEIDEETDYNY